MTAESWQSVAAIGAVVSAVAAAASAAAAWRASAVTLRLVRRAEEEPSSNTRLRRWLVALWAWTKAWVSRRARHEAPRLVFVGMQSVPILLQVARELHREVFDSFPRCVHLANVSSTAAATNVHVQVWSDGNLLSEEIVARIDPLPADAARFKSWSGCQWKVPWNQVSFEEGDPATYTLVVRYSDAVGGRRWELRANTSDAADTSDDDFSGSVWVL